MGNNEISGILNINKPKGITSHDVISALRKTLKIKRIGHTGTLDPIATGVLPICIGKATRLADYIMAENKEYIAVMKLGIQTDTYDITGNIIKQIEVKDIEENKVNQVIESFIGKQEQSPPIYSAIKINGYKAYELARKGKEVELPKREIEIYNISEINYSIQEKIISFKVECSKGTYIRSLCNDIGEKIGTYGTMIELTRTRSGNFNIEDSIDMDKYINLDKNEMIERLINIEDIFSNLKTVTISDENMARFLNGVKIKFDENQVNNPNVYGFKNLNIVKIYNCNEVFIGLGKIKNENEVVRFILIK